MKTQTIPTEPRRRKWPFRVLWGLLALIVSLTGLWCFTYWKAKSERDALLAEIRSRGEPTTMKEIVDGLLKEKREGTGAEPLLKAAAHYEQLEIDTGFNFADPTYDIEGQFKKDFPEPGIHALVEKRIRGSDKVLRLLEDAANRPPGVLTTCYEPDAPASLIPRIKDVLGVQRLLFWVSYDALARGGSDRAYRALWLRLSLCEQTSRDPFLDGHLKRVTYTHVACEHLALCLAYAGISEPRFRQLDSQLPRLLEGIGIKQALFSQRAEYLDMIDDPVELQKSFEVWKQWWPAREGWTEGMESAWIRILGSPLGRPLILREQCAYIGLVNRLSGIIDRPEVNWRDGENAIDAFVARSPLAKEAMGQPTHQATAGFSLVGRIAPNSHRRLILARLALRLRRHYDQKGRFPATLEEICDEAMPKIDLTWFQGLPLVYQPRNNGFLLDVSNELQPGRGFRLRVKESDPYTFLAWDFKLKEVKPKVGAK